MPRVFDYTQTDIDIPMRYNNSLSQTTPTVTGTWVDYGSTSSSEVKFPFCDTETIDGQLLISGSQYIKNISCEPHSYNAGNYYNFPATSASSPEPATSSICPRGWMLPQSAKDTSYSRLLETYGIDYNAATRINQDAGLINMPLSFLRSGYYYSNGTLVNQGSHGYYRMSSQRLVLDSGNLSPTGNTIVNYGYFVRCVAR